MENEKDTKAKVKIQPGEAGKFKGHCRQNSRGIPDGDIVLPETKRNRATADIVDGLMKSGKFKTRRAARNSLH